MNAATTVPPTAPPMICGDCTVNSSAFISSAVSIPSRVIISSVNMNTPKNAAAPVFTDDASSLPSMWRFMCRPARHMCTVSDATSTAATRARTPSQSAWLAALASSTPAPMLRTIEATMPQRTAGNQGWHGRSSCR